jgi:hypothetical protein
MHSTCVCVCGTAAQHTQRDKIVRQCAVVLHFCSAANETSAVTLKEKTLESSISLHRSFFGLLDENRAVDQNLASTSSFCCFGRQVVQKSQASVTVT